MKTSIRTYLRLLGYVEGSSLLSLLLIGMPLKYLANLPELSRLMGLAHGCLFLMYVATLVTTGQATGLAKKQILYGCALSCLPFGPFLFELRVLRKPRAHHGSDQLEQQSRFNL